MTTSHKWGIKYAKREAALISIILQIFEVLIIGQVQKSQSTEAAHICDTWI